MNKLLLPISIVIFLLGLLASLLFWNPEKTSDTSSVAMKMGGNFTLMSSTGEVKLSDFNGKVVLLYFGYTWCPDICPTALSRIAATLNKLGASEKDQVQGIFISVDPERDDPQRLVKYIKYFHPDMIGLTGSKEEVDEVTKRYGVSYRLNTSESESNYSVDHTSLILVIDQQGQFREILPHETSVDTILKVVRGIL